VAHPGSETTTIALSSDRMLILCELVARLNADEHLQFADQAEQRVLWDFRIGMDPASGMRARPRAAHRSGSARSSEAKVAAA